jgi:hypothetical protein
MTAAFVAFGTFLAVWAVFDRPQWAMHAPGSGVAAYLAVTALAAIFLLYGGWRMRVRFDDHGVTIREFLSTYRIGWPGALFVC